MKLLIIDDDLIFSTELDQYLKTCGYVVDLASNVIEGSELLAEVSYDLVLLDILLPDDNGVSFCQLLRAQDIQVPIILMTASRQEQSVSGLNAGADDYIKKPFEFEELAARIQALLRRSPKIESQIYQWQGISINATTSQISFQQKSFLLNAKEKNLLLLLIKDPQRIYSQAHLLKYLWSIDDDLPGEEAIRTLIRRLRQKLEKIEADEMIETVYGLGYRLNGEWGQLIAPLAENPSDAGTTSIDRAIVAASSSTAQSLTAQQIQLMLLADVQVIQELAIQPTVAKFDRSQQIAHRLIGSLGVLKLPEGLALIQAIDRHLDCQSVDRVDLIKLSQQVRFLQAVIQSSALETNQASVLASLIQQEAALIKVEQPSQLIRVLVLDDDILILKLLEKMLPPWGIQVHTLPQASQLMPLLQQVEPDVLILDLNLPDGNGIELCQMLRKNSRWANLSIMILTSQRNSETIRQVYDAGADDFVSKPIVPPEFMARLLNRFERNRLAQEQRNRDPLTGVYQQTIGYQQLTEMSQKSAENSFGLCVIQVNQLSQVAAQYGYSVRDRLLKLLTLILQQQFPESVISRWHGGEFVVGFYTNQKSADQQLQALQRTLNQIKVSPMSKPMITISIGMAMQVTQEDIGGLFQRSMQQIVESSEC